MKKNRKNLIIVFAVLLALALAAAVLAYMNRPAELPETGSVSVKSGGAVIAEYTLDDIAAMDSIEVHKKIVSSSFADDEGLFRGVPLRALLSVAGADVESSAQVVVRSEDGFVAAFPMDEVLESDNIFLAYSKNGESLGTLQSGGVGPFRIIVTEDSFGNRCAKYVSEIEVK